MANIGFQYNFGEGESFPDKAPVGHFLFVAMHPADPFGNFVQYSITDTRSVDRTNPDPQLLTCNFIARPTGGLCRINMIQYFSVQHGDYVQADASDPYFNSLLRFFAELIGADLVTYETENNQFVDVKPYSVVSN